MSRSSPLKACLPIGSPVVEALRGRALFERSRVNIGHGRPRVVQAMEEQAARLDAVVN